MERPGGEQQRQKPDDAQWLERKVMGAVAAGEFAFVVFPAGRIGSWDRFRREMEPDQVDDGWLGPGLLVGKGLDEAEAALPSEDEDSDGDCGVEGETVAPGVGSGEPCGEAADGCQHDVGDND